MIKERCRSFPFIKLSSKRNSYFLCFLISLVSLILLFDLSNNNANTSEKLQVMEEEFEIYSRLNESYSII